MSSRKALLFCIFLGGATLVACRQPTRTPVSTQDPGTGQAANSGAQQAAGAPQGGGQTVTGPVLETMDAPPYTYVRVGTPSGEVWAAAQQFPVKVGDRVVVSLDMPMQNFHSASLNRDFPLIYFTPGIAREGETPAVAPAGGMMASHGTAPSTSTEPMAAMAPPAGGMSIADVWANRKALSGKTVTVGGKVVKFNAGIMGRNWVHLQDGTGKAEDGSNDLTLTTSDTVSVGDVVTLSGTVAVDKDFTAGYAYAVIVENARVVK